MKEMVCGLGYGEKVPAMSKLLAALMRDQAVELAVALFAGMLLVYC